MFVVKPNNKWLIWRIRFCFYCSELPLRAINCNTCYSCAHLMLCMIVKVESYEKKVTLKTFVLRYAVESSFAMTASKLNNSRVFAPWNEMKQNEINESKKYRNNLYIELGNKIKVTAKSNLLLWEMKMYALWFNFHMIATINQMEISLKSTSVYHTIIITMITAIINTEMLPLTSTQLAESRRSCIQNQGRTTSPDLNEIGKVIDWLWIRP